MALTEDLSAFLADFGVPVAFAGSVTGMLGLEDAPGLLVLDTEQFSGVQATDRSILIKTSEKGTLAPGSAITVNGTARVVKSVLPYEDGAFTLVTLR